MIYRYFFKTIIVLLFPLFISCGGGSSSTNKDEFSLSIGDNILLEENKTTILNPITEASIIKYKWYEKEKLISQNSILEYSSSILGEHKVTLEATIENSTLEASITITIIPKIVDENSIYILGKVLYERVPLSEKYIGLDFDNIKKIPTREVLVEALSNGKRVSSTKTDQLGNYSLEVPKNSKINLYISAHLISQKWDVKVVDNTNNKALYVVDGGTIDLKEESYIQNITIESGWGESSYSEVRASAPFAILDIIYSSMLKVKNADNNASFPTLIVNWSTKNKTVSTISYEDGHISTSHYDNGNLYILGQENIDTDEFDSSIIAHEWGHYYEDKFSRLDSIGGEHLEGNILDIRVAYSEGFANALSGMILDTPIYWDSGGYKESQGFFFNLENSEKENAGWYSESSIHRIFYDLYDSTNEDNDNFNLDFSILHNIWTKEQKNVEAFISIFTFITLFQEKYPNQNLDTLLGKEDIAPITNIYGENRENKALYNPYIEGEIEKSIVFTTTNEFGTINSLNNRKYIKFSILEAGDYTIKVTSKELSDPDFSLFKTKPFTKIASSQEFKNSIEEISLSLEVGDYLLDVVEYKGVSSVELTLKISKD